MREASNSSVSPPPSSKSVPQVTMPTGDIHNKQQPKPIMAGDWKHASMNRKCQVKCVFIGDAAIGKTSLIVSYTTNGYPSEYVPTAFDTYSVVVTIDNKPCQLQICDTAGQGDLDSVRPLCYTHTDVFLVCFNVVSPRSLYNVRKRWLPEIRRTFQGSGCAMPPFILVGTQSDLRHDVRILIELDAHGLQPITASYARAMATKLGAISYVECSALTQTNLKEVFDTAILSALDYQKQVKSVSKHELVRCVRQRVIGHPSAHRAQQQPKLTQAQSDLNDQNGHDKLQSDCKTSSAQTNNKNKHCGGCGKHSGRKASAEESALLCTACAAEGRAKRHGEASKAIVDGNNHHSVMLKHFLPANRTPVSAAHISDAKLVGWRKSLTKLSAQEALESESRRRLKAVDARHDAHKKMNIHNKLKVLPACPSKSFRLLSDTEDQGFHDDGDSFGEMLYIDHRAAKPVCQYPPKWTSPPATRRVQPSPVKNGRPPATASVYHYYKNRPLPNEPGGNVLATNPPSIPASSSDYQTPYQAKAHTKVSSKLQTFLQNLSHHSSSSVSSSTLSQSKTVGEAKQVPKQKKAKDKKLNNALRSSSFFFLASNSLKKNKHKQNVERTQKKDKSCLESSSCSSLSSHSSQTFFPDPAPPNRAKQYGSQLLQKMSNSVTELRNRKCFFAKLISSSSSNSSSSTSSYSNCSTDNDKSKLKSKKLKDLYYYDYDDDYEEIDNQPRRSSLFSCCLPFT